MLFSLLLLLPSGPSQWATSFPALPWDRLLLNHQAAQAELGLMTLCLSPAVLDYRPASPLVFTFCLSWTIVPGTFTDNADVHFLCEHMLFILSPVYFAVELLNDVIRPISSFQRSCQTVFSDGYATLPSHKQHSAGSSCFASLPTLHVLNPTVLR